MHRYRIFLPLLPLFALAMAGCGIDLVNTVEDVFRDDPQADLRILLSEGTALTCRAGPTIVVTVDNSGGADARESITTFVFVPGGSVDVRTRQLKQNEQIQLDPVAVPAACFVPDCRFTVLVDASFRVDEVDENNNRRDGSCPASSAPAQ